MKYEKIIKWVLAILFVVGLLFSLYGYFVGFETNDSAAVDSLLYCGYAYALVTVLAVLFGVVIIGGINNPKSLLKILVGLVAIAVIILIAYLLAPGTPAVGYIGTPVSDSTLKMTDTILNLAYFLFGGAFIALISGWIIGATRK